MIGVASQIVFCIFAAAVIGSVAGYLLRGFRHAARVAEIERVWQTRLTQRDRELAALRASATDHVDESVPPQTSVVIAPTPTADPSQFESKLSDVLTLIEKLAKSQERMESELSTLKGGAANEFRLEPPQPKS